MTRGRWVLGAFVLGLVFGAGGVMLLPGRAPVALPRPDLTSVIRSAVTRAISGYVADSARQTALADSLRRENRRLRHEERELTRRQAITDAAAERGQAGIAAVLPTLPPPARDTIATGVAAILAAGNACRASLVNCEERARNAEARVAVAEAGASQARRRAGLIVGAVLGALFASLILR